MDRMVVMQDKKRIVTIVAVIVALLLIAIVTVVAIRLTSNDTTVQETADTPRSLIERAEDAQKRGDVTEALSLFNEALEQARQAGNTRLQTDLEIRIDYLVTSPDSEDGKKPTLPEVRPVNPSDSQNILN